MRPWSLRAMQCFTCVYLHAQTTVDAGDIRTWRTTVILMTGKTQRPQIWAPCRNKDGAGSGISLAYLWLCQRYSRFFYDTSSLVLHTCHIPVVFRIHHFVDSSYVSSVNVLLRSKLAKPTWLPIKVDCRFVFLVHWATLFEIHTPPAEDLHSLSYAAFRLACRSPHCRFDDDICITTQAPLAAEGWPSISPINL